MRKKIPFSQSAFSSPNTVKDYLPLHFCGTSENKPGYFFINFSMSSHSGIDKWLSFSSNLFRITKFLSLRGGFLTASASFLSTVLLSVATARTGCPSQWTYFFSLFIWHTRFFFLPSGVLIRYVLKSIFCDTTFGPMYLPSKWDPLFGDNSWPSSPFSNSFFFTICKGPLTVLLSSR